MTRKIVIAVDFSEASDHALSAGAALADDLGVAVVLVHAYSPLPPVPDVAGTPAVDPLTELQGEIEMDEAVALSTEWAQKVRSHGVSVDVVAASGRPVDVILAAADEHDASLIVVGSHGRSGFRRFILGSVAESLVRQSKRPVMVVPYQK